MTVEQNPFPTTAPHVLVAISDVTEELAQQGIAKGRRNTQQNYAFRGIDDVYNALASTLAKHRLVITPRGLGRSVTERESRSGGVLFFVTVEMEYDLRSAVDGSQITAGPFYGEAMDAADKATNKAQSAAYKYMAMQQFCIPTEGDNDADATTYDVRGSSPAPAPRRPAKETPPPDRHPNAPTSEEPIPYGKARAARQEAAEAVAPSPRPAAATGAQARPEPSQRPAAPPASRQINRMGMVPAPTDQDERGWRIWLRAVSRRLEQAKSVQEVNDIRLAHGMAAMKANEVIDGALENLTALADDRTRELGGKAA